MSTLQVHAPRLPKLASPHAVFARIAGFLKTLGEVFNEAQRQAHEVRRRYPYVTFR